MLNILVTRYVSWLAFALALLLWAAVGYFAWTISAAAEEHRATIARMQEESAEHSSALRLHAIARETKEARAELEELSDADLLEILDTIEALARDTGIPIQIGQAPTIAASESSPLRTASFTIDSQGSFTQVAHVVAFLESLPLPSALDELQFERLGSPESGKSARSLWRVVTKVRFLTTADIPAI
ncbi:hypothetical protein HYW60_01540 [Candidatus Kaiserbacteria bacterium]|nr:hypothetical protein [Candidatus Kaiserbacteria bacterium]